MKAYSCLQHLELRRSDPFDLAKGLLRSDQSMRAKRIFLQGIRFNLKTVLAVSVFAAATMGFGDQGQLARPETKRGPNSGDPCAIRGLKKSDIQGFRLNAPDGHRYSDDKQTRKEGSSTVYRREWNVGSRVGTSPARIFREAPRRNGSRCSHGGIRPAAGSSPQLSREIYHHRRFWVGIKAL